MNFMHILRMDEKVVFKILVLGERALQDNVKNLLAEEKVEVASLSATEKVEESLATAKPDLIVIDFDGVQLKPIKLLTQLYTSGEKWEIVLVAANPSIENVIKCMQLGARDFIQFPRDSSRLLDTLKHFYDQWGKKPKRLGVSFAAKPGLRRYRHHRP